jgi:hypothetical protein
MMRTDDELWQLFYAVHQKAEEEYGPSTPPTPGQVGELFASLGGLTEPEKARLGGLMAQRFEDSLRRAFARWEAAQHARCDQMEAAARDMQDGIREGDVPKVRQALAAAERWRRESDRAMQALEPLERGWHILGAWHTLPGEDDLPRPTWPRRLLAFFRKVFRRAG